METIREVDACTGFERARYNMVEQQIRTWDVLDEDVLDVVFAVKREDYVSAAYRGLAFADVEIPLPAGATMLLPKMSARILQEVQLKPTDSVLEIGAGSGYMAALLAACAAQVVSIDIEPELVDLARHNLRANGVTNVSVALADGALGYPLRAPYDVIVVSAALPCIPDELLQQLTVGGRLAVFVGEAPLIKAQIITRVAEMAFETRPLFETTVPALRNARQNPGFSF